MAQMFELYKNGTCFLIRAECVKEREEMRSSISFFHLLILNATLARCVSFFTSP
jgi:hypothetical protein